MRRVPVDSIQLGELQLPKEQTHYLRDVLRMQNDDPVEAFDGCGGLAKCIIADIENGVLNVQSIDTAPEPDCRITLCVAPPKGERWATILEKCTELGVWRIVPIQSERSVVRFREDRIHKQLSRWQSTVVGAARQSRRAYTPEISEPVSLRNVSDLPSLLMLAAPYKSSEKPTQSPSEIGLFVGPEGGFSSDEEAFLSELGALPLNLGPRILRVETACIAGITVLQSRWGDM